MSFDDKREVGDTLEAEREKARIQSILSHTTKTCTCKADIAICMLSEHIRELIPIMLNDRKDYDSSLYQKNTEFRMFLRTQAHKDDLVSYLQSLIEEKETRKGEREMISRIIQHINKKSSVKEGEEDLATSFAQEFSTLDQYILLLKEMIEHDIRTDEQANTHFSKN